MCVLVCARSGSGRPACTLILPLTPTHPGHRLCLLLSLVTSLRSPWCGSHRAGWTSWLPHWQPLCADPSECGGLPHGPSAPYSACLPSVCEPPPGGSFVSCSETSPHCAWGSLGQLRAAIGPIHGLCCLPHCSLLAMPHQSASSWGIPAREWGLHCLGKPRIPRRGPRVQGRAC